MTAVAEVLFRVNGGELEVSGWGIALVVVVAALLGRSL